MVTVLPSLILHSTLTVCLKFGFIIPVQVELGHLEPIDHAD